MSFGPPPPRRSRSLGDWDETSGGGTSGSGPPTQGRHGTPGTVGEGAERDSLAGAARTTQSGDNGLVFDSAFESGNLDKVFLPYMFICAH